MGRGREVAFVQAEDSRGRPLIEVWVLELGPHVMAHPP